MAAAGEAHRDGGAPLLALGAIARLAVRQRALGENAVYELRTFGRLAEYLLAGLRDAF